MIHTPFLKIWDKLGQFGDQDTKTSQEQKL